MNQQLIINFTHRFIKSKRQKSCSICLDKMRWFQKIKTLRCDHQFHLNCISKIYKAQCPLCEHPIFNKFEEKLLKCKDPLKMTELLQNSFNENNICNIYFFIKSRLKSSKISKKDTKHYFQILKLAYKYCDFTEILANNLNDQLLVEELVESGQINWYKTFNGKTFFELVVEKTQNLLIINLILDKLPKTTLTLREPLSLYPQLCEPSAPVEVDDYE